MAGNFRFTLGFTSAFCAVYDVGQVAIDLDALFIVAGILRREAGYLGLLEQLGEDAFLKGGGTLHETREVAEDEHPLVEHRHQLVLRLVELGHLQIDEGQLVVEHVLVLGVHQLHLVMVTFCAVLVVGEDEVEDADGVHGLQLEVPVASHGLLPDGERGIVDAAVLEVVLLGLLHLDDELLALLVLAVDVEDGLAVDVACAEMFVVEVGDVADDLMTVEQGIEETDEQVLVHLRAEELLEAEVGVWVDVSFFVSISYRYLRCAAKIV